MKIHMKATAFTTQFWFSASISVKGTNKIINNEMM